MLNRSLALASAGALAVLVAGLGAAASSRANTVVVRPAQQAAVARPVHTLPIGATLGNCQGSGGLTGTPCPLVFTSNTTQQEQMVPNTDFYKVVKNGCKRKHYLKAVRYFDYGIFNIKPGTVNTPPSTYCNVLIQDTVTSGEFNLAVQVNIPGH